MSLILIESKTKKYSEAYFNLSDNINQMEREIAEIRKKFMAKIVPGVTKLKAAGEALYEAVNQNRSLFKSPKTQTFHNIRVGLMKGKGKKEFDNDVTIKLIKKHLPLQQDELIKVEEKVIAKALDKLPAADLKKIAVEITDSQDEVSIKPVDSEVQKVISKILSELSSKDSVPVIVLGD